MMKKLLILLFLLSLSHLAHADDRQPYNPDWVKCSVDSDCLVIEGACDWATANKTHSKEAQEWHLSQRPYVECMAPLSDVAKPEARCVNTQCALVPQP